MQIMRSETMGKQLLDSVLDLHADPMKPMIRIQCALDTVEYGIHSEGMNMFSEFIYFFEPTFRCLDFKDFYFVFCCLMLEKTILFVSASLQRLSSSM